MAAIAVDFDGVIHAYSGWRDGSIYGEPVHGAFEALRDLMQSWSVFIHTSRDAASVAEWISDRSGIRTCLDDGWPFWNGNGILLVTSRKIPASAYIDDRGIRFVNWEQSLSAVAAISHH